MFNNLMQSSFLDYLCVLKMEEQLINYYKMLSQ